MVSLGNQLLKRSRHAERRLGEEVTQLRGRMTPSQRRLCPGHAPLERQGLYGTPLVLQAQTGALGAGQRVVDAPTVNDESCRNQAAALLPIPEVAPIDCTTRLQSRVDNIPTLLQPAMPPVSRRHNSSVPFGAVCPNAS